MLPSSNIDNNNNNSNKLPLALIFSPVSVDTGESTGKLVLRCKLQNMSVLCGASGRLITKHECV